MAARIATVAPTHFTANNRPEVSVLSVVSFVLANVVPTDNRARVAIRKDWERAARPRKRIGEKCSEGELTAWILRTEEAGVISDLAAEALTKAGFHNRTADK